SETGRDSSGGPSRERARPVEYTILGGLDEERATALCGIASLGIFEALFGLVNAEGAVGDLRWYGTGREETSRIVPRSRILGGRNGLFFTLFVMRTGVPLVVASSLFGASTQTGTAAFTTWVCFLRKELQPFVRMPDLHEVREYAPKSFTLAGLENVIVVLDATELEIVRVWQTDLAYVLYSTYKRRPTGKFLLGLTPAGAICFISNMYGGRLSDTEVVVRSGFIDVLAAKGFGPGFEVMADRGFNPIARHLLRVGIKLTAPPSARIVLSLS
ncbi:unnamed protein product, partial [Pylaiella littoralis]